MFPVITKKFLFVTGLWFGTGKPGDLIEKISFTHENESVIGIPNQKIMLDTFTRQIQG